MRRPARRSDEVVIGRPINFQGAGGEEENRNALEMLRVRARSRIQGGRVPVRTDGRRDGIRSAARSRRVRARARHRRRHDGLFVRARRPERRARIERDADMLGHAGERIGGNDYDQLLALRAVMALLGYGDELVSGSADSEHLFRRCGVDERRQRAATFLLASHAGTPRSTRARGAGSRAHRPPQVVQTRAADVPNRAQRRTRQSCADREPSDRRSISNTSSRGCAARRIARSSHSRANACWSTCEGLVTEVGRGRRSRAGRASTSPAAWRARRSCATISSASSRPRGSSTATTSRASREGLTLWSQRLFGR